MDKNKKEAVLLKKQPLLNGAGGGTRTHPHNSINVDKSRLFSVVVNFVVNLCVFQHTDSFLYRHVLRLAARILEHILKLLDSVFRTVGAAVPSAAVPSIAGGKAPHTVAASAIAVAAHVTLCVPFAGTAVAIGHHDFVDVLDAVYKLVDDIECACIVFDIQLKNIGLFRSGGLTVLTVFLAIVVLAAVALISFAVKTVIHDAKAAKRPQD